MRVLLIGTGGREHALALGLAKDPAVTELVAAPGNPGIGQVAKLAAVDPLDPQAVAALAVRLESDLVVVGPEAPLVAGVADAVRAMGIPVFGVPQTPAWRDSTCRPYFVISPTAAVTPSTTRAIFS